MSDEWVRIREVIECAARSEGSEDAADDRVLAHIRSGDFANNVDAFSGEPELLTRRNTTPEPGFWFRARLIREKGAISAVAEGVREVWLDLHPDALWPTPPFIYRATGILLRRDDVASVWPEFGRREPQQVRREDAPPRKGGRPPKFEWKDFYTEVIRIADVDGLPETQGEMERRMMDWCIGTWGDIGESTVQAEIRRIYRKLGRGAKT